MWGQGEAIGGTATDSKAVASSHRRVASARACLRWAWRGLRRGAHAWLTMLTTAVIEAGLLFALAIGLIAVISDIVKFLVERK